MSRSSRSRYFVFGFVYCQDPATLRTKLKRYLKQVHQNGKYPVHLNELKFNLPHKYLLQKGYTVQQLDDNYSIHMPEIRTKALQIVLKNCDGVFGAIVDKYAVKPSDNWTPENLGNFVLAQSLIVNVLNAVSSTGLPIICYDKGRLSAAKAAEFNTYIMNQDSYYKGRKRYLGNLSSPRDTSSVLESGIWAADMVAGSYYHKFANNEWAYSNILNSKKIGAGKEYFGNK